MATEEQETKEEKARMYGAALTRVEASTPRSNFMVLGFGYHKIVVPYAAGVEIVRQMAMAETFDQSYGKPTRISPIGQSRDDKGFTTEILSHAEYTDIKVAGLLEINPDEVKVMRLAAESLKKKDDDAAS